MMTVTAIGHIRGEIRRWTMEEYTVWSLFCHNDSQVARQGRRPWNGYVLACQLDQVQYFVEMSEDIRCQGVDI
jgi:hypothetical protein